MSSWIFSLRREMICITDSVICRRQWGYQIQKLELGSLWLWSLCFLYHPIHIPERSTTRHSCAVPRLPCFDELSARPDTLEDALKLRLPLLTGSPLTDCWGLFLSADFSSKCWTVILFLLVLGKLEFCSWRLGWVVHHYPFLHFWLMVSGVSVLGSLVPIAQDLWQLSPLLWETCRRLLINRR